jgi:hypothetical protein
MFSESKSKPSSPNGSKSLFETAKAEFKNECNYVYALIREQVTHVIHIYSSNDDDRIRRTVADSYEQLFDIYTREFPIIGYSIMNVADTNPMWSYHYYSERYAEAKKRLYNAIQFLNRMNIEEFGWEMEGCFMALRVLGKLD